MQDRRRRMDFRHPDLNPVPQQTRHIGPPLELHRITPHVEETVTGPDLRTADNVRRMSVGCEFFSCRERIRHLTPVRQTYQVISSGSFWLRYKCGCGVGCTSRDWQAHPRFSRRNGFSTCPQSWIPDRHLNETA